MQFFNEQEETGKPDSIDGVVNKPAGVLQEQLDKARRKKKRKGYEGQDAGNGYNIDFHVTPEGGRIKF